MKDKEIIDAYSKKLEEEDFHPVLNDALIKLKQEAFVEHWQEAADAYEKALIYAVEEMDRKREAGETKDMSSVEIMRPYQYLYNWNIFKLGQFIDNEWDKNPLHSL